MNYRGKLSETQVEQESKVSDHMTGKVLTLRPLQNILEAFETLSQNEISGAPVVGEDGAIVGILTAKDCLRSVVDATYHSEGGGDTVADRMSTQVSLVEPDMSIVRLAAMFLETNYRRFPVVSEGRLVGMISRGDVLRAVLEKRKS